MVVIVVEVVLLGVLGVLVLVLGIAVVVVVGTEIAEVFKTQVRPTFLDNPVGMYSGGQLATHCS